jgi:hypothetical protein
MHIYTYIHIYAYKICIYAYLYILTSEGARVNVDPAAVRACVVRFNCTRTADRMPRFILPTHCVPIKEHLCMYTHK